ncbi:MAG: TonB-dependent receptor [Betaproteobacteria bacterium]|nr:TonB-dependent receptor [Betaproteobacteria bacterium]
MSLKLGFTPRGDDEYALTYLQQNGKKGQPPSTDPASARFGQWPFWDKESLYFISRTGLGERESLRLRLYLDKFDNEVDTFTDASYSVLRTSGPGSVSTGRSIYEDRTFGGSIELESRRFPGNTVRLIAQYKRDQHEETDANAAIGADFSDTLRTFAVEDAVSVGDGTTLSIGFSHHALDPDRVYKSGAGPTYSLPGRQTANDPQFGLFHDLSPTARLYATFAEKTRLPTLKDRYSQRLNTYVENPSLRAEQARNFEVGYQGRPWGAAQAEFALFQNKIEDKIQSVNLNGAATCSSTNLCQQQNVGGGPHRRRGDGLRSTVGTSLELGGNATFLHLRNERNPGVRLTGIPQAKLTLFGIWRPAESLDVTAFGEQFSGRWASNTVKVGGFAVLNVKLTWRPVRNVSTEVGVTNLLDKNYQLDFGFPNPGRSLFANASYRF